MSPTDEQIEAAKTPNGGWTRAQLAEWGVSWPPQKGWRSKLTGEQQTRAREKKDLEIENFTVGATEIYTDGSCNPNPGKGGWAYVIPARGVEKFGVEANTTNNRMEMRAIIEALKATEGPVRIFSDSQLAIKVFNGSWRGKKNLDLVVEAERLMVGRRVTFQWVRGHNGDPGNERADYLAASVGATRAGWRPRPRRARVG